jgi:hypothetical protein
MAGRRRTAAPRADGVAALGRQQVGHLLPEDLDVRDVQLAVPHPLAAQRQRLHHLRACTWHYSRLAGQLAHTGRGCGVVTEQRVCLARAGLAVAEERTVETLSCAYHHAAHQSSV